MILILECGMSLEKRLIPDTVPAFHGRFGNAIQVFVFIVLSRG